MADDERQSTLRDFEDAVNMTPKQLEDWLGTDESKAVGQKDGGGESVGHESGRRIVEIQRKKKGDYTDGDYEHMAKVVGYVHRHLAQRPRSTADVETSRWRYSLMNWGHDPLEK